MGLLSQDNKPYNIHTPRDHLHYIFYMKVQDAQNTIDFNRHKNQLDTNVNESEI